MHQTFTKHAPNMHQTCTKHAPNMHLTCTKHAPNMPQTCTKNARANDPIFCSSIHKQKLKIRFFKSVAGSCRVKIEKVVHYRNILIAPLKI
jgi:hypothetical protein